MTPPRAHWLTLAFILPLIIMAGLGGWALQGEYERSLNVVQREGDQWAALATERIEAIDEEGKYLFSFAVARPVFRGELPPGMSALEQEYEAARQALAEGDAEGANVRLLALRNDPALMGAVSGSGIPLEALVLRAQLDAVTVPEEKTAVAQELARAALRNPSVLSRHLTKDAAEFLPEEEGVHFLETAEEAVLVPEVIAAHRGNWNAQQPWVTWRDQEWYGDFSQPDAIHVTSLHRLGEVVSAQVESLKARLPEGLSLRVSWRGRPLVTDEGSHLSEATTGSYRVVAALKGMGVWEAEAKERVYTLGGILSGAWLVTAGAMWGAWRTFRKQQRLTALQSEFIASVSHELRTPVASISVLAERLESGFVVDKEKQTEYHGFIAREGRRLAALVDNVLDLSRIEKGSKSYEFEPADLPRLVHETIDLLRPYAEERRLSFQEEITLDDHSILPDVDSSALRQALINLLDNAIKFTPSGGVITVGLSEREGGVCLSVGDTGIGIPTKERTRIFERFYRVDNDLRRETTGAGIGLSLVKHIVEAHGGKIDVAGEPGKGTTFSLFLPLSAQT